MKYLVKFCVFFILFSLQGQPQDQDQGLFAQATQNYKSEQYNKAIEKWNTILDNGQHSAALYYNIANAYYKLNQIGPSIYYYEKALALAPNDTQIKTNLTFAQNAKIDAIVPLPKTFFSRWYSLLVGQFTFDGWAVFSVVCGCLFSLLFLGYYFAGAEQKKRSRNCRYRRAASNATTLIPVVRGPSKSLFDTLQCKELNLVHSYKEIHGCVLEY